MEKNPPNLFNPFFVHPKNGICRRFAQIDAEFKR